MGIDYLAKEVSLIYHSSSAPPLVRGPSFCTSAELAAASASNIYPFPHFIKNIAHRDLKPENIFIHNGVFKIGDFGFAT